MPSIISSAGKGKPKAANNSKVIPRHDGVKPQKYHKGDVEQETITQLAKQVVLSTNHMLLALRYVPKARRKEGETPFTRFTSGNVGGKATKKDSGANLSTLKESLTLPTQNMYQPKVSRPALPGFIACLRHYWVKVRTFQMHEQRKDLT